MGTRHSAMTPTAAMKALLCVGMAYFVIAVLFIQFAVVRPIKRVTRAAERISVGQQADLGAAGLKRTSANEMHQLILATERLRASLVLAMQRLVRKQPPPVQSGQRPAGTE